MVASYLFKPSALKAPSWLTCRCHGGPSQSDERRATDAVCRWRIVIQRRVAFEINCGNAVAKPLDSEEVLA